MAQCKGPRTLSTLALLPGDTSLHGAAADVFGWGSQMVPLGLG